MSRPVLLSLSLSLACAIACKADPKVDSNAASKGDPKPRPEPNAEPAEPPEPPEPPSLPAVGELGAALADAVDRSRYEADLRFIAAPRPPGSAHWQAVQDRCAASFEETGFSVSKFSAEGAGTSVIARKQGRDPELPAVVVGAHYDHIPDCPGADDNASGTAAVLELARVLGAREWDHPLILACWDEEETGLYGSARWADQAVADGQAVALYLNFDAIAYADHAPHSQTLPPGVELLFAEQLEQLEAREFRADFIALLADDAAHEPSQRYLAHAARLELPVAHLEVPGALKNEELLADLRRSDHASFWKHDIPAIFLSDTADFRTDTYHCTKRPDAVDTLDLDFALVVTRAAAGTLAEIL